MRQFANGINERLLIPAREPQKSYSQQETFDEDVTDEDYVEAVLRRMNDFGLTTQRRKPLSLQRVHDILKNAIYCGRIKHGLTGGRVIKACFEPLIGEELFDSVQLVLLEQAKSCQPRENDSEFFPLRRLVRCGHCQRPLTASFSTGRTKCIPTTTALIQRAGGSRSGSPTSKKISAIYGQV